MNKRGSLIPKIENRLVFLFIDYKTLLSHIIWSHRYTRGCQAKLAEQAGCKPNYMAAVIRKDLHLTLEHGISLANHWGLDFEGTHYFLTLLQLARAKDFNLKQHLVERLYQMRKENIIKE